MNLKMSVDDGAASDVRVAELAEKYDIACTFYWPVEWHSLAYSKGYEPLSYQDACSIAQKHTIGSHGITHRHLTQIPEHEANYEIQYSKKMLEDMFMIKINSFAPARGYLKPELTKFAKKFYENIRLTKGKDSDGYTLVHVHIDSGANENQPWLQRIETLRSTGVTKIHCWLHSYDLDRQNLWGELEETLKEFS